MSESDRNAALAAATKRHWETIVSFARSRHEQSGRGVVLVDGRDLLADEPPPLSYVPAAMIPRGDDFRPLIDGYDPSTQVALLVGGAGDEQLLVVEEDGEARPGGAMSGPPGRSAHPAQQPAAHSLPPMPTARTIVTELTRRRARRFPRMEILSPDLSGLDERDAGLALAIDHAVLRRWRTLQALIGSALDRSWDRLEASVQAPLLVGAAQLFFLEKVPAHAAINEAVDWAKKGPRPKSAGMVNAVLRRVASWREELREGWEEGRGDQVPLADGRAWQLSQPVFDEGDPVTWLSQTASLGRLLVERWIEVLGREAAMRLAWHSLVHPPTVLAGIERADPRLEAHEQPGFAVFNGPRATLEQVLADHPRARVQDPAAAAAVMGTAALGPGLIIDACAGRGTKTRQLAALHLDSTIIATDRDVQRRRELAEAVCGEAQVRVLAPKSLMDYAGQADLLVLDVPCSNTGVLARRLEARYRFDVESLESLVALQRQIIADHLPLLHDRGTLLYSTCSVDPAENHEQVRWIAHWHRMEVVSMWSGLPHGGPGNPPTSYSDGAFFAGLRRKH